MATVWQNKSRNHPYQIGRIDFKDTPSIALKGSYLLLQQLDLALTLLAVHRGLTELNPFMKGLLASPWQLAIAKVFIPVLIVWLLPGRFLIPGIVILSAVVGWNIKELAVLLL